MLAYRIITATPPLALALSLSFPALAQTSGQTRCSVSGTTEVYVCKGTGMMQNCAWVAQKGASCASAAIKAPAALQDKAAIFPKAPTTDELRQPGSAPAAASPNLPGTTVPDALAAARAKSAALAGGVAKAGSDTPTESAIDARMGKAPGEGALSSSVLEATSKTDKPASGPAQVQLDPSVGTGLGNPMLRPATSQVSGLLKAPGSGNGGSSGIASQGTGAISSGGMTRGQQAAGWTKPMDAQRTDPKAPAPTGESTGAHGETTRMYPDGSSITFNPEESTQLKGQTIVDGKVVKVDAYFGANGVVDETVTVTDASGSKTMRFIYDDKGVIAYDNGDGVVRNADGTPKGAAGVPVDQDISNRGIFSSVAVDRQRAAAASGAQGGLVNPAPDAAPKCSGVACAKPVASGAVNSGLVTNPGSQGAVQQHTPKPISDADKSNGQGGINPGSGDDGPGR